MKRWFFQIFRGKGGNGGREASPLKEKGESERFFYIIKKWQPYEGPG